LVPILAHLFIKVPDQESAKGPLLSSS